ncbi:MAG: SDR family NAD(P)-dependent oxidoreductase [Actinobacteria bacterium]|nr:SDR family NAD(P)-dependent oxidoreductase [Actinomycetota bacterium]MCL6104565.1 SDR family NAD(P)-dependent oxidoreductase [Actinomycetota bacterium]
MDKNGQISKDEATGKVAVVTGASSGIGKATAITLAQAGYKVVLGARRMDRLVRLAAEIDGIAMHLDVTDPASVEAFTSKIEKTNILVNNAGGALGLDPVAEANEQYWEWMYQANVLGSLRMTKALLPKLEASNNGHIVLVTSVAAHEVYRSGGGYTAAKHAQSALGLTLRLELLGKPVHITEIAPGMVETEFSITRFEGDQKRAKQVYENMTPLSAEDVADCILWAVTRPPHVNIDTIVVKPLDQARAREIHRSTTA